MIGAVVDKILWSIGIGDDQAELIQGSQLHKTGRLDFGTVHQDDGIFGLLYEKTFDAQFMRRTSGDDAVGSDAGKTKKGSLKKHITQQIHRVGTSDGTGGFADDSGQAEDIDVWKLTESESRL